MDKYKIYQDKESEFRKKLNEVFEQRQICLRHRTKITSLARKVHTMKMLKNSTKCEHDWAFDICGDPQICIKCFGFYDELYG